MRQGKRKIHLTPHFRKRWRERIGEDTEATMRRVLHAALLEKSALRHRYHYFTLDVRGRRAVFSVDMTGFYVFVTILQVGMKVEGVSQVGSHQSRNSETRTTAGG